MCGACARDALKCHFMDMFIYDLKSTKCPILIFILHAKLIHSSHTHKEQFYIPFNDIPPHVNLPSPLFPFSE